MSGGYHRFKWGYGKTLQEMGKAHNLELLPQMQLDRGITMPILSCQPSTRRRGVATRSRTAMVVVGLSILATILMYLDPSEAHCFSRWYYPWTQHCSSVLFLLRCRRNEQGTNFHRSILRFVQTATNECGGLRY